MEPITRREFEEAQILFGKGGRGVKPWAKRFYKSAAWKKCRDAFFAARFGLCERCGGPGKIVHHKIWLTPNNIDDPAVSLNWDNLELLCQKCHNEEHHAKEPVAEGLGFDEDGNLIRRGP